MSGDGDSVESYRVESYKVESYKVEMKGGVKERKKRKKRKEKKRKEKKRRKKACRSDIGGEDVEEDENNLGRKASDRIMQGATNGLMRASDGLTEQSCLFHGAAAVDRQRQASKQGKQKEGPRKRRDGRQS